MSSEPRTFRQEDGTIAAIPSWDVTRLMLELLELKLTDKLLEIGTGSATQTQEWAKHCEVYTIELKPVRFADRLGDHVFFQAGDGIRGIPEHAPYEAIVSTCGVEQIPPAWSEQLAEGGRLVVPLGSSECQKLTLLMKKNGILGACRVAGYCRFQMMEEA